MNPKSPTTWQGARQRARSVLDVILSVAFGLTAACVFIPLQPRMPDASLDYSWMMAMNVAIRDHIAIGRDVVFTFGPYSSIYSMMYSPATDLLMVGGGLWLGLCFVALASIFMRRSWAVAVALLYVLASFMFSRDALFNSLSLFYVLFASESVSRDGARATGRRATLDAVVIVMGASAMGLLVTVKVSLILLAVVAWLAVVALVARARRPGLAAAVALAAPLTTVLAWLVAGQPLAAIPSYFVNAVPISGGYTEAMSTPGPALDVLVYLGAAALCLCCALLVTRRRRFDGLVFSAVLALFLFVSFKGAFVRQDGHVLAAGTAIVVGALALMAIERSAATILAAIVAVGALVTIDMGYMHSWRELLVDNTRKTYVYALDGIAERRSGTLAASYDEALARIRREAPLPALAGTSDLYFHSLAYLLVSDNRWDPRPVFQSYSAYTPFLLKLNAGHLDGARAPDNLFVKMEAIDQRFPQMDDGLSWFGMLGRYEPHGIAADTLILTKKPPDRVQTLPRTLVKDVYATMGEAVDVPRREGLTAVTFGFKRGLGGKLVSALFKPPVVTIVSTLADGSTRVNRIVPEMTETDFLLSPYIETANEFALLYGGVSELDNKQVVSFVVEQDSGPGGLKPTFDVKFSAVPAPVGTTGVAIYDPVVAMPALDDRTVPREVCSGSIDRINGAAPASHGAVRGPLAIDGWAAPDLGHGVLADAVMIGLRAGDRIATVFATHPHRRGDLAAYFSRPEASGAGYDLFADISGIAGDFDVVVLLRQGTRTVECSNLSVPVHIGAQTAPAEAARPASDAPSTGMPADEPVALPPALLKSRTASRTCLGSIDRIGGAPLAAHASVRGLLTMDGWAALDPATGGLPRAVWIELHDVKGFTATFPTHSMERKDLSAFFKNEDMSTAGYATSADTSGLDGDYTATVMLQKGDDLIACSNLSAPVTIR